VAWTNEVKGLPLAILEQVPVRPRQYEQPPILEHYKTVVSRGGRPDLALAPHQVTAPTLLLVEWMFP
jgi:hypothetical protein